MNKRKPFPLAALLCLLLLAACAQNQPPEALEEQSAAQSARVDFPASIQFEDEMEWFDFTGSVHVVVQCRTNPRSTCDINTNLSDVSGTGQESGKRFQVVGASQHSFSRLPGGGIYEFSATYSVVPQGPANPSCLALV